MQDSVRPRSSSLCVIHHSTLLYDSSTKETKYKDNDQAEARSKSWLGFYPTHNDILRERHHFEILVVVSETLIKQNQYFKTLPHLCLMLMLHI